MAVALCLLPACALAQLLDPTEALDRYLAKRNERQFQCSDSVFEVRIDASLPKLGKHGTMRGLKFVSQTGRIAYRSLRFTGDDIVKTAVIARYLVHAAEPFEGAESITRENYSFLFDGTSDYNGLSAYVFRMKPKRKRFGLFAGELWLAADSAELLRVWGDLVKSPSIFIRTFRFVQDYQNSNQCVQPGRLLLTVGTRITGRVEMAVWLHSTDTRFAEMETAAVDTGGSTNCGLGLTESGREAQHRNGSGERAQ